ncbi:MAG: hypothetical protein IJP95_02755 [Bacteroidales bacterium]|nr:hypothetical protein [Bacteroidales bacterium]
MKIIPAFITNIWRETLLITYALLLIFWPENKSIIFVGAGIFFIICAWFVAKYRTTSAKFVLDQTLAKGIWGQLGLALNVFLVVFDIAASFYVYKGQNGGSMAFADFVSPVTMQKTAYGGEVAIFPIIMYLLGVVVFTGLVVATINRIAATRADNYKLGHSTYRKIKDHYIIIGYGETCVPLIANLKKRHHQDRMPYIIILTNQNVPDIRRDIQTQLPDVEKITILYSGNLNSERQLQRLNIPAAREVFVLGEKEGSGRDSMNLECAKKIKEIRQNSNADILRVNVQFDKAMSYSTIKQITIPKDYYSHNGREITYLRPFNFFENWARMLWGTFALDDYRSLDRGQMTETEKHVHLVIVGLNNMGVALMLEALRLCHYPNYDERSGHNKTVITVVDNRMDQLLPLLKSRYRTINQISDVELQFCKNNVEDQEIRSMLKQSATSPDTILTVAICLNDPDQSLSTALSLPDSLFFNIVRNPQGFDEVVPNKNVEILVRQQMQTGLAELLSKENDKYHNIKVFGTLDKGMDDQLVDDIMPMIINAFYNYSYGGGFSIDTSKYPSFFEYATAEPERALSDAYHLWIPLNEDMRFANRYQIEIYRTYQTYRQLLEEKPAILYQMEHLRWLADRCITGYRNSHDFANADGTHGIKDKRMKLHFDIIPYYDLTEDEKDKDKNVVKNMDKVVAIARQYKEKYGNTLLAAIR